MPTRSTAESTPARLSAVMLLSLLYAWGVHLGVQNQGNFALPLVGAVLCSGAGHRLARERLRHLALGVQFDQVAGAMHGGINACRPGGRGRRGHALATALAWVLVGVARGLLHHQGPEPGALPRTWSQAALEGVLEVAPEAGDRREQWLLRPTWVAVVAGGRWRELPPEEFGDCWVEVHQGGRPHERQPPLAHWRQHVVVVGSLLPCRFLLLHGSRAEQAKVCRLQERGLAWFVRVPDPQHVGVLGQAMAHGPVARNASLIEGVEDAFTDSLASLRRNFEEAADQHLGARAGALMRGVVLGDGHALDDAAATDFRVTGTYHVVAASGLNVSIVAAVSEKLVQGLGIPGPLGVVISLMALWSYTALAGAAPSLVRAAIMGSLTQLAFVLQRGTRSDNSLAFAVVSMVTLQPALVDDLGFQLSVASVLGIRVLNDGLQRRLTALPSFLAAPLAVTLSAQLATLPLQVRAFAQVSLIAPLANLLLVPPTELALVTGLGWWATLPLTQVPGLGWLARGIATLFDLWHSGLLLGTIACAHGLASLPAANLQHVTLPWWYVPLWYLGLLARSGELQCWLYPRVGEDDPPSPASC